MLYLHTGRGNPGFVLKSKISFHYPSIGAMPGGLILRYAQDTVCLHRLPNADLNRVCAFLHQTCSCVCTTDSKWRNLTFIFTQCVYFIQVEAFLGKDMSERDNLNAVGMWIYHATCVICIIYLTHMFKVDKEILTMQQYHRAIPEYNHIVNITRSLNIDNLITY